MQSDEVCEQRNQHGPRPIRQRAREARANRLHPRLRSCLDDPLSQGDLWLLLHRGEPFVVLRNQLFFNDAFEMTSAGRNVIRTIGRELANLPGTYSLVAGHVDSHNDWIEESWTSCHEAWRQARAVEGVLAEAGADPARVFSVGLWRMDSESLKRIFNRCSPGGPFVVTIHFTTRNCEYEEPWGSWAHLD